MVRHSRGLTEGALMRGSARVHGQQLGRHLVAAAAGARGQEAATSRGNAMVWESALGRSS